MSIQYIKKYPLSLLVATIVTIISLIPFPEMPDMEDIPFIDKWTHFVMYGGLTITIWFEYLRSHTSLAASRLFIFAFLMPITMSGIIELMQEYLTTSRNGDFWDFLANSIGVGLATILGYLMSHCRLFMKKQ